MMLRESIRLPAAGAILWVDAGTPRASDPSEMAALDQTLDVSLEPLADGLSAWHGPGRLVLYAPPPEALDHFPSEAERAVATPLGIQVKGTAMAGDGRYHPRRFEASLPAQASEEPVAFVPLYRSRAGTTLVRHGGLVTNLRFGDAAPASWALLKLTVDLGQQGAGSLGFSAQADRNGDLAMSFAGLPPLAEGVTGYAATLSVRADQAVSETALADPDKLPAAKLGSPDSANSFATNLPLNVKPGEVLRPNSAGKSHLAVQAA